MLKKALNQLLTLGLANFSRLGKGEKASGALTASTVTLGLANLLGLGYASGTHGLNCAKWTVTLQPQYEFFEI